ncbi:MAG: hypothetical protein E6G49_10065 [Actinobacteria bacterium]|nr:MAG: hypothetical protein E6G49_10065 [Actinomycetota bacterium]
MRPLRSAPRERLAHRDGVADHADPLEVQVAPQIGTDEHPGILDRRWIAVDRRQDLVAPPDVLGRHLDGGWRIPPGAAAAGQ